MGISTVSLATSILPSFSFSNSNKKHKLAFNNRIRTIVTCSADIHRSHFPNDFFFGAASSAFQTESGPREGGRGASIVDDLIDGVYEFKIANHADTNFKIEIAGFDAGRKPGIEDGMVENKGSIVHPIHISSQTELSLWDGGRTEGHHAAKSLQKYNEDVLCLKNMGMDVYRFSFSWPRLFPSGKVDRVNSEGVAYYLKLLEDLKLNGITPIVTLFHFDLPLELQSLYLGTIHEQFVRDYAEYADFCFKTFGRYVKHWITMNEPHMYCKLVYPRGFKKTNNVDDRSTFPYWSAHNLLKAHAEAVRIYRNKYQARDGGKIGITLDTSWNLPHSDTCYADKNAVERAWDFTVGWFLDPIVRGDYPCSMKMNVGDRLPSFCPSEKELIKDSFDFIGINYYSSSYVQNKRRESHTYEEDGYFQTSPTSATGNLIGPAMEGFRSMNVYPQGLREVLLRLQNHYCNPLVYITENGYAQKRNDNIDTSIALKDDVRIKYIRDHLKAILEAIRQGANVKGYIVWNLLDCVEFGRPPYDVRFGLNFTDYGNDYNRIPKDSAKWFKSILSHHHQVIPLSLDA